MTASRARSVVSIAFTGFIIANQRGRLLDRWGTDGGNPDDYRFQPARVLLNLYPESVADGRIAGRDAEHRQHATVDTRDLGLPADVLIEVRRQNALGKLARYEPREDVGGRDCLDRRFLHLAQDFEVLESIQYRRVGESDGIQKFGV